jgi:hypothetical protein
LRRQRNVRVALAEVDGVDRERKCVCAGEQFFPYDVLVLASGSSHSYFGYPEWEAHAPGAKSIEDATAIRRRVLLAFERVETAPDATARRCLLTFVVVGGGPTGVEMAGTLAELARRALTADFRRIGPREARIVLVEAGHRLLGGFGPESSAYAAQALADLGVEVRTGARITSCEADGVTIGGERLEAGTVIWAAGVVASPVARGLGVEAARGARMSASAAAAPSATCWSSPCSPACCGRARQRRPAACWPCAAPRAARHPRAARAGGALTHEEQPHDRHRPRRDRRRPRRRPRPDPRIPPLGYDRGLARHQARHLRQSRRRTGGPARHLRPCPAAACCWRGSTVRPRAASASCAATRRRWN